MATRQIDHGIVRLAQGGDVASFEMILSFYQRSVYNFALRQVRNREDAEDVTQDVFIKLFKNIKRFNFKNKFSTWLFAIAQNLVNDFFRKKKRRREVLIIDNQDAKSEWLLNRFANTSFDAAKNLKIDIDRAMNSVRPIYSKIITLFYNDGLAYKEIAERLFLPVNTVKTYIYRAKKDLARELA